MNTASETMSNLAHQVTFAPQINQAQVKMIAEKGYKTIICNRPDNEEMGQPSCHDIEEACNQHGLSFKSIPFTGGQLTHEKLNEFAEFFNQCEQPIYMYCRSGNRSNIIYQASVQMKLLK